MFWLVSMCPLDLFSTLLHLALGPGSQAQADDLTQAPLSPLALSWVCQRAYQQETGKREEKEAGVYSPQLPLYQISVLAYSQILPSNFSSVTAALPGLLTAATPAPSSPG